MYREAGLVLLCESLPAHGDETKEACTEKDEGRRFGGGHRADVSNDVVEFQSDTVSVECKTGEYLATKQVKVKIHIDV